MKLCVNSTSKHSGRSQLKDMTSKRQPEARAISGELPQVDLGSCWSEKEGGGDKDSLKPRHESRTPIMSASKKSTKASHVKVRWIGDER